MKSSNVFLALWIKNDPELWSDLRDIQKRILLDRIVREMSFAEMAAQHKVAEGRLRQLFESMLNKIDRCISPEVARHLRAINNALNSQPGKPFEAMEVFLN